MGYNMRTREMNLQTVVETPEFINRVKECMDDEARIQFIDFIAKNPLAGEVVTGTGGARKVRWQSNTHSGKRGGTRIIYYYHDEDMPIYLFTAYKKITKRILPAKKRRFCIRLLN